MKAQARMRGTGLLEAIGWWRDRLARHYKPGEGGAPGLCSLDLNGVFEFDEKMVIEGAHLLMLLENRIEGSVSDFWHLWARWFLQRTGLPAPEDFGERTGGDVHPAARLDTAPGRLFRVAQRFPPNTAEAWAARIEWRFLTGLDGGGAAEVARFVGALRALELMPFAQVGLKFRGRKGKPGKVGARVAAWRKRLPKLQEGERRGPSQEAEWIQSHCADAEDLSLEAIRKNLYRYPAKKTP